MAIITSSSAPEPCPIAYNHCLVWVDFVIEGYVYMVTLQYKQAAYIAIQLLYFTNMEIKLICQQHNIICKKFILQSRNNIILWNIYPDEAREISNIN